MSAGQMNEMLAAGNAVDRVDFHDAKSRIIVLLVALGLIAMAVPVAIRINEILRFSQSVTHVADTIRSFDPDARGCSGGQWKEAVKWTANVIYQDFFASNSEKLARAGRP
ncbi:MAG: hypothetical protein Ct9H300mP1_22810 [Planctomycetaceae bacterium]|nr:MAG: hypothetical protein Ct9H300mP1_22810 [Planctomycetaceae bacterium]